VTTAHRQNQRTHRHEGAPGQPRHATVRLTGVSDVVSDMSARIDMTPVTENEGIMVSMRPELGRRLRAMSACVLVGILLGGCMSDRQSTPDAGKVPASPGSGGNETATAGGGPQAPRVNKVGKPPLVCALAAETTPAVCVHALFHRYPNFAPNSMCDPVARTARRLHDYGFEVSVREVSGPQPSNIVTNWWAGGTRGIVHLVVGGANPSCAQ
jgi:hypothetical protein